MNPTSNPDHDQPDFTTAENGASVLEASQWVSAPLEEVFEFFSRPENLERLTPSRLKFSMRTDGPLDMREGLEITYRLRVHGIPLTWVSRVPVWNPPHRFQDIQVKGPYKRWVHTHTFEDENGGTRIRDRVEYRVPGGRLVEKVLVRRDLRKIFSFRHAKVTELFA